ncbi:hypothetical protein NBRC110019_18380 [Neptunitalea chrysea]|uniref:Peptidase n=1 Tax=Neptunitalea chrysea TaxID=1647581 RepID=A0A9W6B8H0_9FLAO|nr:M90 family metallopeptidase [Neptunitalea chrysea]GLB52798.1 hypothetical protein NBRC110019_18380 [Neptunitalea chrysea]
MEYVLVIVSIVLLVYVVFFKKKKKKDYVFPNDWEKYLHKLIFYKRLTDADKVLFQQRIMKFLDEVIVEGVNVEVTDYDKVLVAVGAVIPTLAFKDWYYPNLRTVLLYPDAFNEDFQFGSQDANKVVLGVVGSGRLKDTMILSKKALHHGFENDTDKLNTAIHEFVHLIDGVDGAIDGIPKQLLSEPNALPWLKLIHKTMEDINKDKSDIRNYGGTSQAEFFAVASEYFFSRPKLMKRKHPEVYKMLEQCFNQNPAS